MTSLKSTISRTGVYGIAIKDGKLLLVKQCKGPHSGKWELPGGGIEAGETAEDTLRREFREEVGMSFDNMQFLANLTAITDGIDEKGNLYHFHQMGSIYLIDCFSHSNAQPAEMEHAWIDPKELETERVSPFVRQIIDLNLDF
jgi:ADP-ribose pyrophosphatase YjhB (NUDIX family)